ncbi:hypothetical protein DTO013E5_5745 [Penicillium roqueforti]|uniref:uncharacterized protein n=1 Tax=Penicillium roqueforti TaxID=5082 RepID=UPI00190929D2|nr:uncharacterized protein LCP9604111_7913 [Penicillium roqueforti]KAF9242730.1 hypothetical protein LCP9604111_7913 [Penicillium roqueforti]KAI1830564.1 hypothetical protein CBS147337_8630 [Penicillium roqueforti]KAI2674352.1 hypothetical protein CBS147355_6966 [Penicillium roqueforti]KAI2683991.1 hypothetical protein LCP963914a_5821 [Penicillium roqueforti]KAI2696693.1 hypothetical protein CBS147372_8343 [Penicillium roqueforti]
MKGPTGSADMQSPYPRCIREARGLHTAGLFVQIAQRVRTDSRAGDGYTKILGYHRQPSCQLSEMAQPQRESSSGWRSWKMGTALIADNITFNMLSHLASSTQDLIYGPPWVKPEEWRKWDLHNMPGTGRRHN